MKNRKTFKKELRSKFDDVVMGEGSEPEKSLEPEKPPIKALKNLKKKKDSSQAWTRVTYVLDPEIVEKIRALAYWKRVNVKKIATKAFEDYLDTVDESFLRTSVKEYRKHKETRDEDLDI